MAEIGQSISKAKELLVRNELVAVATETVYGLAANALSEQAVLKIFEAKKRPHFDPLIIHLFSIDKIDPYVKSVPDIYKRLYEHFCPGPLTFVFEKNSIIPDLVTSGRNTVAVRFPSHPLFRELLQVLDFPLAAPSANPFTYVSPVTALHVQEQLGSKIPYILDGGSSEIGIESTIVHYIDGVLRIYRLGGLSVEEIRKVLVDTEVEILNHSESPSAPGQLKSHYSPGIKLYLDTLPESLESEIALLRFKEYHGSFPIYQQFILSKDASLETAAKNLFAILRKLSKMNIKAIYAERVPNYGLGMAINDRLERAAAS